MIINFTCVDFCVNCILFDQTQTDIDLSRIDLRSNFDSRDFMLTEDFKSESAKMKILKKVKSQRQQIENAITKLKDVESVQNFNQYDMERHLIENLNDKDFLKFKKLMNKLENTTNLIFGLEIRFNEKKICNSKEGLVMLMYQIKNAQEILDEFERSLEQFTILLNARLNPKFCDTFLCFIAQKKYNLCLRRSLVRELYFIHLKFDIINLLWVIVHVINC